MRAAKNVLLTGSGFIKDFGGYLADEMWPTILSQKEMSKYPNLRQILLSQLNYEQAYHEVLDSSSYTNEEKAAFTTAVETAYRRMHRMVRDISTYSYFRLTKPLLRGIVFVLPGQEKSVGSFLRLIRTC